MENRELLFQPKRSKAVHLSKAGKEAARKLLTEYNIADKDILEKFKFRNIRQGGTGQTVDIKQICFPPNEACSERNMIERIAAVQELFLVAVDKETGKIAGFLNGIADSTWGGEEWHEMSCTFKNEVI